MLRDTVQEYSPSISGVNTSNAAVSDTLLPLILVGVTRKFLSDKRSPFEFLHSIVKEVGSISDPLTDASHRSEFSLCATVTSMGSAK